jgi:hypothetical protein
MRDSLCALAILGSLAASRPAFAVTLLMINGQPAGEVRSFEGGDPRGAIVSTPLADGTLDKHVGAVTYAPLALHLPLPLTNTTVAWIGTLASGALPTATIQLVDVSATGSVTAMEYAGAALIDAQLPALDAGNPNTGDLTLTVQVTGGQPLQAVGKPTSARVTATGFRLTINGLDSRGVQRIEPLTFHREQPKGELQLSNLIVTLTEATSGTWRAWFNDFVVNATNKDEKLQVYVQLQ